MKNCYYVHGVTYDDRLVSTLSLSHKYVRVDFGEHVMKYWITSNMLTMYGIADKVVQKRTQLCSKLQL